MAEDKIILESYFNKANKAIEIEDFSSFFNAIYRLYDNLTCNCFLAGQDKSIYLNQLAIIEKFEDNDSDYNLNISKGYLYSRIRDEEKAYHYLTLAISINSKNDLAYALRSNIDSKINQEYLEDAKNAVLLNPSARNYFVLARAFDYKKDKSLLADSITYFDRAIGLNPNFACAYNNRAYRYMEIGNLQKAIDDFKQCIKIEPNHWAYYEISKCLSDMKKYNESLDYAKIGIEKHPNDKNYYFRLGYDNIMIGNFEEALMHFKTYIKAYPESDSAKNNIAICKENILQKNLSIARSSFNVKNYQGCIDSYSNCIIEGVELSDHDANKYLIATIQISGHKITIDENNQYYKRLVDLRASYFKKNDNNIDVTEAEKNANKLMQYGLNHHIGFGNYKDDKICDIAQKDPHYILWCILNLEHFSVDNSILLKFNFKDDPLYVQAIEINLIKELVIVNNDDDDDNNYYQNSDDSYDDYDYSEDSSFCPACQESPCMCSDPGW